MNARRGRYEKHQPVPGVYSAEQETAPANHRISRCKVALSILGLLIAILLVCAGVDAWVAAHTDHLATSTAEAA
jgi:hypothetical protein